MENQDNLEVGDLVKTCYTEDEVLCMDKKGNFLKILLTENDILKVFYKGVVGDDLGVVRISDNVVMNSNQIKLQKIDSKLINLLYGNLKK